MEIIEAIWKIGIYICIMLMFLFFAKKRNGIRLKVLPREISLFSDNVSYSFFTILILSALVGWYSGWQFPFTSDRGNYAVRFIQGYYTDSTYGLRWLSMLLRKLSDDSQVLFFSVSFFCVFIILVAVNKYECKTELHIALLIASTMIPTTFYLLKQAPAVALAALAIAMFFRKKMIFCIILTVAAILFHESAVILIPLYIVMLGAKKRWIRIFEYMLLIAFLLFFRRITVFLLPFINSIDYLESQTSSFAEATIGSQAKFDFLTIVKGLPVYIITVYALLNRARLRMRIKNYDQFLTICCVGSTCVLLSAYMYWMFRFAIYCYLPIYVFASLLQQEMKSAAERTLFAYSLCGLLIFFTLRFMFQTYC